MRAACVFLLPPALDSYVLSSVYAYFEPVALIPMKHRVTVSLARDVIEALDRAPGENRSQKVERLLKEALVRRAHARWVHELQAFYHSGRPPEEQDEDRDWQRLAALAFDRDD